LQAQKNDLLPQLVYIGEYDNIPAVNILNFKYFEVNCILISLLVSEDEMLKEKYLKIMTFIVEDDDQIFGSLELVFEPIYNDCEMTKIEQLKNKIDGKFKIVMNKPNVTEIVKILEVFPGGEESIYLLTTMLLEENIIEKIIA